MELNYSVQVVTDMFFNNCEVNKNIFHFMPKSACSVCVCVGIIQTGCDKHMFFGFALIHDLDNTVKMWSNKLQGSKSKNICLWTWF